MLSPPAHYRWEPRLKEGDPPAPLLVVMTGTLTVLQVGIRPYGFHAPLTLDGCKVAGVLLRHPREPGLNVSNVAIVVQGQPIRTIAVRAVRRGERTLPALGALGQPRDILILASLYLVP